MKSALNILKRFAYDETGLSTVEVILILVEIYTVYIMYLMYL